MSDDSLIPPSNSPTNTADTVRVALPPAQQPYRSSPNLKLWVILAFALLGYWLGPTMVQHYYYAATRGREQAQADVAKEQLRNGSAASLGDYRFVVKAMQPSVVGVKARRVVQTTPSDELSFYHYGPSRHAEQDQGSGVIVEKDGYIVTNAHVVESASDVQVELSDGSTHRASIIGVDMASDLAVLKIDGIEVRAAAWGDSEAIEVGDPVLAIGNPFGLVRTVTAGILSAKGRHAVVENVNYQDFLQTDAAVNPGNSGGPLVNMHGEVVGINTAILGPTYQGISFAIPSNLAKRVYEQLRSTGKVARGWLGVTMQPLTPELAEQLGLKETAGVVVAGVMSGSPADTAGLQPGDVIVQWNDKRISDPRELGLEIAWSKIGSRATVTIVRKGGVPMKVIVTVAARPERL